MMVFYQQVLPKVIQAARQGFSNVVVRFDEIMNPSLYTLANMKQLNEYINTFGDLTCVLSYEDFICNTKKYFLDITISVR